MAVTGRAVDRGDHIVGRERLELGKSAGVERATVEELRRWFFVYAESFKARNSAWVRNIDLKVEHTMHVCREIVELGRALGLGEGELHLAEVMALLHDVGRFEQYARYETFVDRASVDHAEMALTVLREHDVLAALDPASRALVERSILFHNRRELPELDDERLLFFARLLRDADKLDIWRVVTDYYRASESERNGAVELNLPDLPGISPGVLADVMAGHTVDHTHLERFNDFKVAQMAWVFDVNFAPTLRALRERGYLEMIRDALPATEEAKAVYERVAGHLDRRALGAQQS